MKVMLISPEMTMKAPEQPLGILYLASCLHQFGHEVRVVDMTPMDLEINDLMSLVEEFQPRLIGVSSMITTTKAACSIAKAIKKINHDVITIAGGPQATVWPEHFVTLGEFDYAFVGEGEVYFSEFCNKLENNASDLKETKGLVFIENGKVKKNQRAPHIGDIDGIPFPARDLVNMDNYQHSSQYFISIGMIGGNFNVITTRGCPFHCNFCDHSLFGYHLRERSITNVLDEIEEVWNSYKIPNLEIDDDTFGLKLSSVKQFCQGMKDYDTP